MKKLTKAEIAELVYYETYDTREGKLIMGRTRLIHSIPLIAILMAVALLDMDFVRFVYVGMVSIVIVATAMYFVIGLFSFLDKILDFLYKVRL